MSEQFLDVKRVLYLIRRHRGIMTMFVVAALAGSILYVMVSPPLFRASSLVLLPGTSGAGGQPVGNDMSTDAQIATSAAILEPIRQKVVPSLSLLQFDKRIFAAGTATNVLRITALGTTAPQAKTLANMVASNLVKFVTGNGAATNATGLVALRSEASDLTKQINTVNTEIASINSQISSVGASSSAGQRDTSLLTALTNQQSQSTLQLNSINSQIALAQLGSSVANAGTEVIQSATIATKPSILGSILTCLLTLLAGLALGAVVIVFAYRGDRRLRTRDQIAEAVGVPVVMSLDAPRISRSSEWVEVFEKYEPTVNQRWRVRKVLRDLELKEGEPGVLVLLVLAGDVESLTSGPQIAVCAAALGSMVSLNVGGTDQRTTDLRAVMERLALSGHLVRPRMELQTGIQPGGLTIAMMVVDPSRPDVVAVPGSVTVMVVSAGVATEEDLARVALAATDAGQPIEGIVVTNPDPADTSVGRIFETGSPLSLATYRQRVRPGMGVG